MSITVSTPKAAAEFILRYVREHADERGEVLAREVITAGEDAGFTESAITKARCMIGSKVGRRKIGRRGGWAWYSLQPPAEYLLQDSTDTDDGTESSRDLQGSSAKSADSYPTVGFRLYQPEHLIEMGRCPVCSFHPPTQGHRDGCPRGDVE
ncbi:hypothetical protein M4D79_25560 [Mycolicibacterium novocastrense]|nr:hypothetical protein M4D79_25560 [Mycolicibacterium novocastrense]